MTEHEKIRELLAFEVAGATSAEEQSVIWAHVAGCEACARELRVWEGLAAELRNLAVEEAPPAMVARTRVQIRRAHQGNPVLMTALAALAWSVAIVGYLAARLLFGVGPAEWWACFACLLCMTAGVAALFLGRARRRAYEPL